MTAIDNRMSIIRAKTEEEAQYRLCQVHIICRHGARTPIHLIPGLEEATYDKSELSKPLEQTDIPVIRREENGKLLECPGSIEKTYQDRVLKGGSNAGQLTICGQQQAYDFGVFLRRIYMESGDKLLSPKFSRDDVYLRATNINRNFDTLRCIIAGLYGKAELTEPIVINALNDKDDIFYPNSNCKVLGYLIKRDWRNFEPESSEMMQDQRMMEKLLKIDNTTEKCSFIQLRDDLYCRISHGLPAPLFLMRYFHRIDKHAARQLLHDNAGYNREERALMVKLIAGPVLRRFRDRMDERIKGLKTHKLYLYGSHDSTLTPLTWALGAYDYQWPPFLANIRIELLERPSTQDSNNSSFFIKVYYCNKPVTVPGCSSVMCPYDEFWKALSNCQMSAACLPSEGSEFGEHRELFDSFRKEAKLTEELRQQPDENEQELLAGAK